MKPGARIAALLLGLSFLPDGLSAAEALEAAEPAKAPRTRMHRQLNQLIRQDAGVVELAAAPVADDPPVAADTLLLEPMIVEEPKLEDLPPPETRAAKFFRTGTLWEKIGRRFTKRFWMKGDRGIMFSISW
jgi:hypothetical protein